MAGRSWNGIRNRSSRRVCKVSGWPVIQFFRVVTPLPSLMITTTGVVAVGAALAVLVAPQRVEDALAPVLTLQLFGAASGFLAPARRGYYDLLLTRGYGRWSIVVGHWWMSIAPGVCAWGMVSVAEAVAHRSYPGVALATGSLVALLLVSALAWAFTVGMPRFSGAIAWLVVVAALTRVWSPAVLAAAAERRSWEGAVAVLVYPYLLVGRALGWSDVAVVAPPLMGAVLLLVGTWYWAVRADYPLEAQ
jgi:hypothetical protein